MELLLMPDLIAQGPQPGDRWRLPLPSLPGSSPVVLGRDSPPWSVSWDDRVSRRHAQLAWDGRQLVVQRLIDARNPIFHRGAQREHFKVGIGEHFVIGRTTFTLVEQQNRLANSHPDVLAQHTFDPQELRQVRYRDADRRIDVLSRLPEIIQGSSSDEELFTRMVSVLLQGIAPASFAAVVAHRSDQTADNAKAVDILHWDGRQLSETSFSPSSQLVRQAVSSRRTVLHLWNSTTNPHVPGDYTQSESVDWAFCTPLEGEACQGWAIYVAGDLNSLPPASTPSGHSSSASPPQPHPLSEEIKFAELAATTLSSIRQSRELQRRQDSLRSFFAPVVLDALSGRNPDEVLSPREADVSVLFCDLRGFSKQSEESGNRLLELLQRVSKSLGVMTHHILADGGVVGDFHGDAAMGFWGWPFEQPDSVLRVCRAALAIQAHIESPATPDEASSLAGFQAGLGIASGRAVAGRIGTADQVKVTVFGPVVNLASRLEGMTKILQASILLDEATAERVRQQVPAEVARVRRVARVLPYGMNSPLMVSQLLEPASPHSPLSDHHIACYEEALDAFQAGRWSEAFRLLHHVPAEDRVKDFLTVYIAQHGRTPPPDWQGLIRLPSK